MYTNATGTGDGGDGGSVGDNAFNINALIINQQEHQFNLPSSWWN